MDHGVLSVSSGGTGMNVRWRFLLFALLIAFAGPIFCQAQAAGSAAATVPAGTKVDVLKYGPEDTSAELKPAEQVAFLMVYAIWNLEGDVVDKDSGLGRMCTLAELVKGVNTPDGFVKGLTVDPARDRNYRYDLTIIGDTCIIRAIPNNRTLAGFAVIGTPGRFSHDFYINPNGPDMTHALKITEMGYSGRGFRR